MTTEYDLPVATFLKEKGIRFKAIYKNHAFYFPDDQEPRDIYQITLRRGRNSFSVTFGQSIANAGIEPSSYDVLACLTKYEPGDFNNFCFEYGYYTDSRKAEKTYKAVIKEWDKVSKFFSEEELDVLREIAN